MESQTWTRLSMHSQCIRLNDSRTLDLPSLLLLVHSQHHVGLTSALYRKVNAVLGDKTVFRVRLWAPKPQLLMDLLHSAEALSFLSYLFWL